MNFGERLKDVLESKGLNQADLSSMTGIEKPPLLRAKSFYLVYQAISIAI